MRCYGSPNSTVGLDAVNGTHHFLLVLPTLNSPYLQRSADLSCLTLVWTNSFQTGLNSWQSCPSNVSLVHISIQLYLVKGVRRGTQVNHMGSKHLSLSSYLVKASLFPPGQNQLHCHSDYSSSH